MTSLPDRAAVQRLLDETFPDMGGDYYGETVHDVIFIQMGGDEVIGHLAVFAREVEIDGCLTRIGLLGGVSVAAAWRRKGLAKALIAAAHEELRDVGVAFSVLFAVDPDRYMSSGYVPMVNETRFLEAGKYKQFVYHGGMVASLAGEPWNCHLLDLRGEVV